MVIVWHTHGQPHTQAIRKTAWEPLLTHARCSPKTGESAYSCILSIIHRCNPECRRGEVWHLAGGLTLALAGETLMALLVGFPFP